MAANAQTYLIRKTFHDGPVLRGVGSGEDADDVNYISGVPSPLIANDSFDLIVDHYEYHNGTTGDKADFGASATAKLYITFDNVPDLTPLELCDGTVAEETASSGVYNRISFAVPKNTLSDDYAGSTTCRLYYVILFNDGSVDRQRTVYWTTQVHDQNGTGTTTIAASTMVDNQFVARSATINLLATGQTTIYTVPTGYVFIAQHIDLLLLTITTPATPPTLRLGISTDTTSILPATLLDNTTQYGIDRITLGGPHTFAAGTIIQGGITAAATHAAATAKLIITGYLVAV